MKNPLSRLVLTAALAAGLSAALAAPAAAEDAQLPPGVVARVYEEDITEAQLLDRLARRHETTERGRQVLEQIVDDLVVAAEAARRGVTVSDAEARSYGERMTEIVRRQSGGQKTLDDVLRETGTSWDEFVRTAREYLTREKMARADLGTKPDEELAEHRMKLWTAALRRRAGVRFDGLPHGVLARIGNPPEPLTDVDRQTFARELRTRLPLEVVAGIRAELVVDAATRHAVRAAGIEVTDADVDEQIARLRERFEKNPKVQGTGVTFDSFLRQTFGIGEAELRTDPTFRSRVGLERMLGRDIDDAKVKKYWDENRAAYGDRVMIRQVYVPAGEAGGAFAERLPSPREAMDLALRAKVEILEKSGLLKGAATANVADVVSAVAKRFEPDAQKRTQAGEPVAWTRLNVAGEAALESAVFDSEIGQLVGPIRSQTGYHVIYVEERRPAPPFDDVKLQVRDDLLRIAVRNFQLQLRADGHVIIPELK